MQIVWVAMGGAIGSVLRYLLHKVSLDLYAGSFPLGTFLANIAGAAIIGLIWAYAEKGLLQDNLRLLLMIGVLGGFTTFSSFALESLNLLRFGKFGTALLYVGMTNMIGFLAVASGFKAGKFIWG